MIPIYLEPDEEITSVIEKISNSESSQLALVVPKNSTLFQSLVNLKLLSREAKNIGKTVVIISGNKVGSRLAKQVGILTYGSIGSISSPSEPEPTVNEVKEEAIKDEFIDGVPVHQYNPNRPHSSEVIEAPPIEHEVAAPVEEPEKVLEQEEKAPVIPVEPAAAEESAVVEKEETESTPEEMPVTHSGEEKHAVELPPIVSRMGRGVSQGEPWKIPWRAFAIASGIIVLLLGLLFFLLPKATLTITLPAEAVSAKFPLIVQAQKTDEGTIAGNLVESQQSSTTAITATGKKDIGTKATGTISITNKYRDNTGAGKDQTFPAGTKATDTKTKKVFTLNSAVTVTRVTYNSVNGQPIYDTKSVKVTASEPGESYNIAATTFTLAGALDNTDISSSEAFTGGLTKQVTVLSQEDVDKATAQAKTEAEAKAKTELQDKAKSQVILPDAIWQTIVTQKTDHAVGDQTDTASLQLTTTYSTFAVEQSALDDQLKAALSKDLPEGKELVIPEEGSVVTVFKGVSEDKTKMTLELSGSGYQVQKINRQQIAREVHGRSISSAQSFVKDTYHANDVQVVVRPSWFFQRLPFLSGAIQVEYGFGKQTEETPTP